MATQGIVSVTRGGTVVAKVVVGMDGQRGALLADLIVKDPGLAENAAALYEAAESVHFGPSASRVAMTEDATVFEDGEPPYRYRQTFSDPRFNPRWERGDGARTWIVELEPRPRIVEDPEPEEEE